MIRSSNFWTGIVLLAIIPLLLIDIAAHTMNWKKEVREEMISAVHNEYQSSREEKALVLDRILERNQVLNFLIYVKTAASVILFSAAVYFFNRYRKEEKVAVWKSMGLGLLAMSCFVAAKVFLAGISGNERIHFLPAEASTYSLADLYKKYYHKGKVLYIDFWGTTCGPCLKEFRDFTQPLKKRYASSNDLSYLYVSRGNSYIWKQQLQKYQVEGDHIFLDDDAYDRLFREAVKDSKATIEMPRYVILDKTGAIADTHAKQPSDRDSLYAELDKYLLR